MCLEWNEIEMRLSRNKTVMACQAMLMVLGSQWRVISRRVMQVGLHCRRMTVASVWGPKWRRQY